MTQGLHLGGGGANTHLKGSELPVLKGTWENKWHACPGPHIKFINFAKNGTHAQPRRIGTIKDECVGRAMPGVEVIALGDGTLVDR